MAERRIDAFFYGLFMDLEILEENQVEPVNPRQAYLEDFGLRIGRRATLVPAAGARAYGMVFELTHDHLDKLYSAPGLTSYRPEAVLVQEYQGATQPAQPAPLPALCYNLGEAPGPDEANAEYATRLRTVLSELGFPAVYIASVA